jgi:TolB-like protein/class 3 adenylate cyclase/Tfp pilus assembly protein PilF
MPEQFVERKLAAILVADIAGYSRLIGLDEEGTLTRLRALRRELIDPTIAEHRGRIFKTTGDGMLVEFASVVDAVRCAVAVQRTTAAREAAIAQERRIEFRVGINLGDIVVEGDDILGDGVNIAARLEAIAVPGGICLSRAAVDQVVGKIAAAFSDLGDRRLKNIARPVRVFAIDLLDSPKPQNPGATAIQLSSPRPRLSIVVLPFANLGGDHEQEYFADGITESLTTDLSRISGAFVIARNSAFAYKGKAIDLRQIGRDLNVRYALEGSVQRGGKRLRVNVQLIDCDTGTHLWAERFDQGLADLLEMQDEIVARLAGQLGARLVEAEARHAERSPDPDSMDLYFQARALMNRGSTAAYLKSAEALLERALELDPNNVDALAAKGWVDIDLGAGFMTDEHAARLLSAEATAIKALSLAPNHAWAHLVLGSFYNTVNRGAEAITEFEHALQLDRNLVYAHALIGMAKTALGRAEEAETHYLEALRLSPRDVAAHHWMSSAGTSKLHLGKHEEAVAWFRRAIDANRNFAFTHLSLAAALAHLGSIDQARAAAKAGLDLEPSFTISRFSAGARSDNPVYLAGRERIYQGMRRAGIPE